MERQRKLLVAIWTTGRKTIKVYADKKETNEKSK
jgi:hypothetical protein